MNENVNNEEFDKIIEIIGMENVKHNESMSKHTSFRVGGNADLFISVNTVEKLKKILELNNKLKLPITIVGNGSNLLVSDKGIRGIVIKYIGENYKIYNQSNDEIKVTVEAGMLNGKLAQILLKEGLTGFEFASGIPGTIGGAIFMNAGAYGKEMKDIVEEVTYIDLSDEKIYTINQSECEFTYRNSKFERINSIIVSAKFKFSKENKEEIKNKMEEYRAKRIETQPCDKPNAGSTFKRGEDFITAKLIDEAGLKGYKIGGAEISTKHAGFIVNSGNATAEDIKKLIEYTQAEIMKKYNKKIEAEVRFIGE